MASREEQGEPANECTVIFVDLAGFTALTEAHGDEQAADLAERFVMLTQEALGPDDRLIKSIGDAVMVTSPTPATGLETLGRLLAGCRATPDFPIPRAGLHHGPIVQRGHDVFGAAVNLAARIAGKASGDQVLGTASIAAAAGDAELQATSMGHVRLRNIAAPVELFEIQLTDADPDSYAVDPVCRMRVEPGHAAGRLRHGGTDWWFCSLECAAAFAQSPDDHVHMNN
jgi:adenylate cyclase